MARGDMMIENLSAGTQPLILNRKEFEATANTIDFTSVTADEDTGKKVVKAGTPINKDGVPVTATPWTGAVGILLYDTYEERPQQPVLKKAYIHTGRAQSNCGLTYDAALVAALTNAQCRIVFEEPVVLGALGTSS